MSRPSPTRPSRHTAIRNFIATHNDYFTPASGSTEFKITVSKFPEKWRYQGKTSSPPSGFTTNLLVEACISWQWINPNSQEWYIPARKAELIVLGSTQTLAPKPAHTAWILTGCLAPSSLHRRLHGGSQAHTRYLLTLGRHTVICAPDQTSLKQLSDAIIEQVRLASIRRIHHVK